ncbi:hypothetical protein B0A50_08365 [Salinomyces thailandicus]|uniref:Uncharacterized protein n=1 Tax=Salinomyces thailandicus TaxID=706561 RepID=A0A4U0TJU1_9PEZI|nr:hypothetical protein B0A50_08365 [Salinomyces thailandica]
MPPTTPLPRSLLHHHSPTPPPQLLTYKYVPYPKPLNHTTLPATRQILSDPTHPFHIRAKRRYANFDPNTLHWRVACPLNVSKKKCVRDSVVKRLRGAVEEGLRGGWGGEGLKGALLVVVKGEGALGLKSEDIAGSVRSMLGRVGTAMREAGDEKRAMGSEKGGRGE